MIEAALERIGVDCDTIEEDGQPVLYVSLTKTSTDQHAFIFTAEGELEAVTHA